MRNPFNDQDLFLLLRVLQLARARRGNAIVLQGEPSRSGHLGGLIQIRIHAPNRKHGEILSRHLQCIDTNGIQNPYILNQVKTSTMHHPRWSSMTATLGH